MVPALVRATALLWGLCGYLAVASAQAKPTAAPKGSLNVLTYNVAGLPEGISSSNPSVNMPLIGKLLNRYDLALVQEDFVYGKELRSAIAHRYVTPAYLAAARAGLGDGLSQFSRTPFVGYLREQWRDCNGVFGAFFDCLAPKGFTFARHLLARGVTVDVYNIHLDAGDSDDDARARKGQLRQLAEAIERLSQGRAVIVAGDSNLEPSEAPVLRTFLARSQLLDVCQKVGCPDPWCIDRVLYRNSPALNITPRSWRTDASFVDRAGVPLSDHLPVSVTFDWNSISVPRQASAAPGPRVADFQGAPGGPKR